MSHGPGLNCTVRESVQLRAVRLPWKRKRPLFPSSSHHHLLSPTEAQRHPSIWKAIQGHVGHVGRQSQVPTYLVRQKWPNPTRRKKPLARYLVFLAPHLPRQVPPFQWTRSLDLDPAHRTRKQTKPPTAGFQVSGLRGRNQFLAVGAVRSLDAASFNICSTIAILEDRMYHNIDALVSTPLSDQRSWTEFRKREQQTGNSTKPKLHTREFLYIGG